MSQPAFYLQQLRIASLPELARQLSRWWLAQFVALFPRRLATWLAGDDRKRLAASIGRECVRLELQDAGGRALASVDIDRADYSAALLDRFLAAHRLRRADLDIGIDLAPEQFFERRFLLPAAAQSSLAEIATQDLARKTPFRLAEIHHDFRSAPGPEGKIQVVQWVTRRTTVAEIASTLQLQSRDIAFLTAGRGASRESPAFLRLREGQSRDPTWMRWSWVALIGASIALAITALGLRLWDQQVALDNLESQLATLAPKARDVRARLSDLEHAQAVVNSVHLRKQNSVCLLDAWQQATRIIPLDTWLTELRLTAVTEKREPQIVMTGFSTAAARLVGLIDASPLFSDASITAPISRDNVEERERFSIEATLRTPPRRGSP
jgi:general secretion pathway protein L